MDQRTQCDRILEKLKESYPSGKWVPLPEIMPFAAQYNARLFTLRREGWKIENRTASAADGGKHSFYRLCGHQTNPQFPILDYDKVSVERRSIAPTKANTKSDTLFGDISKDGIGAIGL